MQLCQYCRILIDIHSFISCRYEAPPPRSEADEGQIDNISVTQQTPHVSVAYNDKLSPVGWPGKIVLKTTIQQNMFHLGEISIYCRGKDQGSYSLITHLIPQGGETLDFRRFV